MASIGQRGSAVVSLAGMPGPSLPLSPASARHVQRVGPHDAALGVCPRGTPCSRRPPSLGASRGGVRRGGRAGPPAPQQEGRGGRAPLRSHAGGVTRV